MLAFVSYMLFTEECDFTCALAQDGTLEFSCGIP